MKSREEALKAFRLLSEEEKKKLHERSDHAHWSFDMFKASTTAIQRAFNKP